MFCIWVTPADAVGETISLCGDQLRNAGQVVGDQIEHEVSSDACDAAMFGLAHGAMLLAPAEDAFDHRPARLRHSIAVVPCGAPIDGALAITSPSAVVLGDMGRDVHGAKPVCDGPQ